MTLRELRVSAETLAWAGKQERVSGLEKHERAIARFRSALLFQPSTNGIDVYDGGLGTLRTRISLPVSLSENFDALVGDGTDNVLIAISGQTGSGIAIVDLSSLAHPAPLPYLHAQSHPSSLSLPAYGATSAQPRIHLDSTIRTGGQIPITAVKHIATDFLPHQAEP